MRSIDLHWSAGGCICTCYPCQADTGLKLHALTKLQFSDFRTPGVFGVCRSAASGHSIFLSHSGAQKNFVEQLCVDLESCNRSVFFDKRSDSLPKGEPFPQHIFKAIQECQVGVVVLSEEFFSSKWPMLELVAMSKRMRLGNSRLKIMPIFLSISPIECRDVRNHGRWLSTWCEWAQEDKRMDIEEWKEALKLLGRMNGFVYKVGLGEVKFRKEIVKEICKVVSPTTTWDDSHVEGRSRLCKVRLFIEVSICTNIVL